MVKTASFIILLLCGDVMTGRGIDQILPHRCDPVLYEPFMQSAWGYVELARKTTGPIPYPVDFAYIWGDALREMDRMAPDVRIINLETSITQSEAYWPKGINYRMHPKNIGCLSAARIDCGTLANNHVMDWGYAGLGETLATLKKAKIKSAGAGLKQKEAKAPAVLSVPGKGRVLVWALGAATSGIPASWAATADRAGVNFLPDLSENTARQIGKMMQEHKKPGDIVVASIHWGGNWGYEISREEREFAHRLIEAGVDVIHGHSSHHVKGMEVYQGKLILYGCGDFLTDYEGIGGYEEFRSDLGLMYFVRVDTKDGKVAEVRLTPTRVRHFRVNRATGSDVQWLKEVLDREGKNLGTRVRLNRDNTFSLEWNR